jgi:hypothetical protein
VTDLLSGTRRRPYGGYCSPRHARSRQDGASSPSRRARASISPRGPRLGSAVAADLEAAGLRRGERHGDRPAADYLLFSMGRSPPASCRCRPPSLLTPAESTTCADSGRRRGRRRRDAAVPVPRTAPRPDGRRRDRAASPRRLRRHGGRRSRFLRLRPAPPAGESVVHAHRSAGRGRPIPAGPANDVMLRAGAFNGATRWAPASADRGRPGDGLFHGERRGVWAADRGDGRPSSPRCPASTARSSPRDITARYRWLKRPAPKHAAALLDEWQTPAAALRGLR